METQLLRGRIADNHDKRRAYTRDLAIHLVAELGVGDLALVEGSCFCDSLLLKAVDDVLVAPSDLVREALDGAVLASRLEAEDAEGVGDDHLLLLVVRGRGTLEELDALDRRGSSCGLVRQHTPDGAEENLGWGAEVEGSGLLWVHKVALVKEVVVAQLHAEERAADVDELASHNDDLLAVKGLLGDDGGQSTEKVTLAVNDDGSAADCCHLC